MHFRVFFKINVQNMDICLGCKIFKKQFWVLYITDILFGK